MPLAERQDGSAVFVAPADRSAEPPRDDDQILNCRAMLARDYHARGWTTSELARLFRVTPQTVRNDLRNAEVLVGVLERGRERIVRWA